MEATATTGGFDYARAVDDNLVCAICSEPAINPLYHESCHGLFCSKCLKSWLPRSPTCPKCRAQMPAISSFVSNKFIEKLLNELPIYCPNKASGCTTPATINRGDLAAHLDKFCVVAQCTNKAKGCKWQGARAQLNAHLQFDCPNFIVACSTEGCPKKLERQQLAAHLAASCEVLIKRAAQEAEAKKAADELKKKQEEQVAKLALLNPIHTHIVTLNVGGTRFQVSAQLLLKYPTSVLGLMFSGKWEVRCNQDNVVFLEMDPIAFATILRWLQTGQLIDSDVTQGLTNLAKLLELRELEKQLEPVIKKQRQERLIQRINTSSRVFLDEDLSGLCLLRVGLLEANFSLSNMERCILRRARMAGSQFEDTRLMHSDLSNANFTNAEFIGADLRSANICGAILVSAKFNNAELGGANLSRANLTDADCTNAKLSRATLCNANLKSASFKNATLNNADFRGANIAYNTDFSLADLRNADLSGCVMTVYDDRSQKSAKFIGANLTGANLTNANVYGADWKDVNLTGTIVTGVKDASIDFKRAWSKHNGNATFPV